MTVSEAESTPQVAPPGRSCSAAEVGAIAHLYRAEIYRSTVWRTRLDSTTNWAVVTTGIALSATFAGSNASPVPMALVAGWCSPTSRGASTCVPGTSARA